jgi:type III secretory pathway component EscV
MYIFPLSLSLSRTSSFKPNPAAGSVVTRFRGLVIVESFVVVVVVVVVVVPPMSFRETVPEKSFS